MQVAWEAAQEEAQLMCWRTSISIRAVVLLVRELPHDARVSGLALSLLPSPLQAILEHNEEPHRPPAPPSTGEWIPCSIVLSREFSCNALESLAVPCTPNHPRKASILRIAGARIFCFHHALGAKDAATSTRFPSILSKKNNDNEI